MGPLPLGLQNYEFLIQTFFDFDNYTPRFSILTAYIRIDSGHYTAAIYNEEKDNFYLVNDYSNEEITSLEDEIPGIDPDGYPARLSTTVYLVTYEKQ